MPKVDSGIGTAEKRGKLKSMTTPPVGRGIFFVETYASVTELVTLVFKMAQYNK
jgi:hypothetical protein